MQGGLAETITANIAPFGAATIDRVSIGEVDARATLEKVLSGAPFEPSLLDGLHLEALKYAGIVFQPPGGAPMPLGSITLSKLGFRQGLPATAAFAIDGVTNTSWATDKGVNGVGQSLVIRVSPTTNIDKIGFLNGNQDAQGSYLTQPRPATLRVTFSQLEKHKTASGAEVTETVLDTKNISLKDSASFQSFTTSAKNVAAITVTIESVYTSSTGHNASLAEVELFKKS